MTRSGKAPDNIRHLRIDYDEGDPESYHGVVISGGSDEIFRWNTGDPPADWAACRAWRDRNSDLLVLCTSSVTHFLWDVPGWRMIEDDRGREILVPEDRPEILAEEAARGPEG